MQIKQFYNLQQQVGAAKVALDHKTNELSVNCNDVNLQKEVQ